MDPALLDESVAVAVHAAAGDLQREIAEIGTQRISEADLRRAVRSGLQFQLGRGVQPEVSVPKTGSWGGRLGPFDVAISDGQNVSAAFELKWCRHADNLAEALWDVLKLLPYTIGQPELSGMYLVYGAAEALWSNPGDRPAELFSSGDHQLVDIITRYAKYWTWLLTGNKSARPTELRSEFTTRLISAVPILSATEAPWQLRCVGVQALDARVLYFDDGLISDDQPAFGPPAPASRYIDTLDDLQIDPATLPENRALVDRLDQSERGAGQG